MEVDLSGYEEACQVELAKYYHNDKRKYKQYLDCQRAHKMLKTDDPEATQQYTSQGVPAGVEAGTQPTQDAEEWLAAQGLHKPRLPGTSTTQEEVDLLNART